MSLVRCVNSFFLSILLASAALLPTACRQQRSMPSVMFGSGDDAPSAEDYDLSDIQAAGELIVATLSGPDTYYEYRGEGFGLQFHIAQAYARSIGARLRMEIANDTAELARRLATGEADLVALALPPDAHFAVVHGEWTVRTDSPTLLASAKHWWTDETRPRFVALEQRRNSKASAPRRATRPPMLSRQKGIISQWDDLFIRHAGVVGWDWRLLAAQCYQESGFDQHAVSWAGAQGLMQLMPATAARLGLSLAQVFDPERNVEGAARYLRILRDEFSDIHNREEQIRFMLAAYNGGPGHVRDAMALARKHGRNPQRWADVDYFILHLAEPAYYRDPVVRFGYLRGSETSGYVRQILDRWAMYRGSAPPHHSGAAPLPSQRQPSRVRSRSEFVTDSLLN